MSPLDNTLELHHDWVFESKRKLRINYTNVRKFSVDNDIDYLDAFWFFKGGRVREDAFKAICDALDLDWKIVQSLVIEKANMAIRHYAHQ